MEAQVAELKAEGVRLRAAAKAAAKAAARTDQEVADAERQLDVQRARLDRLIDSMELARFLRQPSPVENTHVLL